MVYMFFFLNIDIKYIYLYYLYLIFKKKIDFFEYEKSLN